MYFLPEVVNMGNECECCEEQDMNSMLMDIGDEAWMELMKEKMKKHLEKTNGANMDKIAQIAVEIGTEMWKNKMMQEQKEKENEDKMMKAMTP
jgi:hypothetical protein